MTAGAAGAAASTMGAGEAESAGGPFSAAEGIRLLSAPHPVSSDPRSREQAAAPYETPLPRMCPSPIQDESP
ncbi:hypothetical protein A6A07_38525 [Streptomyces sp. CB03911]|nr:hypothetical protein A6A07_38525 [Streptomyces sp. CB03911]